MRNVLGSFAQFERDIIVERIKTGLDEKRRQGHLLGTLPVGYRRSEAGGIEQHPMLAPLVAEAFERYATGAFSLSQLAAWAHHAGFRTQEGNPHTKMSLRDLLTTVSYTGQVARSRRRGGGVVGEGRHPAIVDMATFNQVQGVLTLRRYTKPVAPWGRQAYPLSGVAHCAHCAAPFVGLTATNRAMRYMRCATTHKRGRAACEQPMVRAELLEAQIAAYVGGMRLPPEYVGQVVTELRQRHHAVEDLAEATKVRRAVERLKSQHLWGDLGDDEYRGKMRELQRRLAEIERPAEVFEAEKAIDYLRNVGSLWDASPRETQRDFVREVFATIEVAGPQVTVLTPRPGYAPLFVLDRNERFQGRFSMVGATGFEPATS